MQKDWCMCIHIKGLCNKNIAILQYYQYVSVFTLSPKHHFVSPYISVLHFHHIKWYIGQHIIRNGYKVTPTDDSTRMVLRESIVLKFCNDHHEIMDH